MRNLTIPITLLKLSALVLQYAQPGHAFPSYYTNNPCQKLNSTQAKLEGCDSASFIPLVFLGLIVLIGIICCIYYCCRRQEIIREQLNRLNIQAFALFARLNPNLAQEGDEINEARAAEGWIVAQPPAGYGTANETVNRTVNDIPINEDAAHNENYINSGTLRN